MIASSKLLLHKMAAPLEAPATLYTQVLPPVTRICACYSNLFLRKMAASNLASVILCGCLLVPKIDIITAFRNLVVDKMAAPWKLLLRCTYRCSPVTRICTVCSNLLLRKMAVFEIPLFQ
jgi:hypothetical protein